VVFEAMEMEDLGEDVSIAEISLEDVDLAMQR
jgi:hypothetical protein